MELSEFCSSSRVIIVAGKGGVGKTTVAAALAVAAARAGRRALLVELEGKSGLASTFGQPGAISTQTEVYPGVSVLPLAPDDALLEYLEDHGMKRVSKKLVSTGALDVVATAVPGMKDILVLGKVKALQRARAADVIVVDGPATGHAVTFLLSPKGMLDAVRVGPVLTQAVDVTEMLADPERARVVLVAAAEETPVNEAIEAVDALTVKAGLTLGPVVVNGVYESGDIAAYRPPGSILSDAAGAGVELSDGEARRLAQAAWFLDRRSELQRHQIERLGAALEAAGAGFVELPFLFRPELGQAELERLADRLTDGFSALAPVA